MILSCGSIDQLLNFLSLHGASEETIRAYRSDLTGLLTWLESSPQHPTTMQEMETACASYLTLHRKTWAAKTTCRKCTVMRSWAKANGAQEFLKDYRLPTPEQQKPHPIPEGMPGVDAMLAVARTPQKKALVTLCARVGLRVSEACAVVPADFDVPAMKLKVVGKGAKTRTVPLSKRAWEDLQVAFMQAVGNRSTLVVCQQRSARASITSMGRRAKLGRRVASHDLRSTFATAALEATKDLSAVQDLMGHADPATTRIYTSVSEERMREAVEAL